VAATDEEHGPARLGRRQRNRREKERAYLAAAMAIAGRDGLSALTMARLADEVDAAVGSVYTYFPSKGALVAELQREAIERLTDAYHARRDESEERLVGWDPAAATVARLSVFGSFWIESVDTHPSEARFLHVLISESEELVPPEEHYRVMPAAMALLDEARASVVAAGNSGAISVDDPMDMVIRWAAALTGALLTSNLAPFNPTAFDGRRLARLLQRDLLVGWGASPRMVDVATEHVASLRAV
jgi:AcrR family transcriptional regulator